jgi:heat shock protein beta
MQLHIDLYSYVVAEPKTKTIKETKWDWELLNSVKAIWLRNPKDVTPEEYDKFYHSLAKVFWFVKSS